mgnify:CR=1 FL=1|jgi:hypothetical protein
MAMADYIRGRSPAGQPLPISIKEYIVVEKTGWTLEYVRNLSLKDYEIFTTLALIHDRLKPSFKEQVGL